jgi:uncharacterized protein YneF (UPF0154 family)
MTTGKARIWSTVAGVAVGGAVSGTAFLTIGVYLLFGIFYGCHPSHRDQPDPNPCSEAYVALWTTGIVLASLALFTVTFAITRRLVMRKLSKG